MRKTFTLVEMLVVLAILSMLAALLLPALQRARQEARRAACLNNEKQVGRALLRYREDSQTWPGSGQNDSSRSIARLYDRYVDRLEVFSCPSTEGSFPESENDDLAEDGGEIDYLIDCTIPDKAVAMRAVYADRKGNHRMEGVNVVFADGHARWCKMGEGGKLPNPHFRDEDPDIYSDDPAAGDEDCVLGDVEAEAAKKQAEK